MERIYWRRIIGYPAAGPDGITLLRESQWDAEPLTDPEGHDTGWRFVTIDSADPFVEGDINEQLDLCGGTTDPWNILDSMAVWGALALAGVFQPSPPNDRIYGCDWKPRHISGGGTNESPSAEYESFRTAIANIWERVAPGMLIES